MYVIIKKIKNKKTGKVLPVIILNSDNEVLEFETFDEAEKMKSVFQQNSDSGHIYEIKKF